MGTWGTGPFDSDTAEDFLDELEERPTSQRVAVIEDAFRAAIEAEGGPSAPVPPEEVVAAAAVVAANVPAGSAFSWNEEYPGITEWLMKPIMPDLALTAVRALEMALPADGWFWRSWVDAGEREEARATIDSLRSVLRPVSES